MPRCSRGIEGFRSRAFRPIDYDRPYIPSISQEPNAADALSFFQKGEGRVGIMPSTRLGGAGTPYLWELSTFPDLLESRLRHDAIRTGSPPPDPPPAWTR